MKREDIESMDGEQREIFRKTLEKIKNIKINVLIVGGTGVGKSSTINALFQSNGLNPSAKVGEGASPETMEINSYHLNNLIIWDTPGLGDSAEKDLSHQDKIVALLKCKDDFGKPLIDLIFLILDGQSRDFSSAYKLIKDVISPNIGGDGEKSRLLIGLNKADKVMPHKFWDQEKNCPNEQMTIKLDENSEIVRDRIKSDTGYFPDVIYYSAGEIVDGEIYQPPYNLAKLLSFIVDRIPAKKRAAIFSDINENKQNFSSNDSKDNYQEKIEKSFFESFKNVMSEVLEESAKIIGKVISNKEIQDVLVKYGVRFLKALLKK